MVWIKLTKSGTFGNKNDVVQCVEHVAKQRIKDGFAVACAAPKRERVKLDNKALSAAG